MTETKDLSSGGEEFLATLRQWLARAVKPKVLELEHADEYPSAFVEQMRDFGLFGSTIPSEYGGLGMPVSLYSAIVAAISEVWMSLTGVLNSHLMMAELVNRYGTEEQRHQLLPLFASGEYRGGLALTEPDCGSDLQAIRTQATRVGERYILSGRKAWITNGMYGNCMAVLVKTDPDAEPRHSGMSLFFVRRADGFSVSRKLSKLGYKGVDTVDLVFDDVAVSASQLIGGAEGHGFHQAVGALELGRINVAARGLGIATAAFDASLKYSRIRKTMGRPIGEHQAIQLKLADMACRVASARLLIDEAARAFDQRRRCDLEAGMAKLVATEAALANATEALRIHASYGYSTEDHLERYFRDAPLLCIGEGTNEIQRLVIARRLLSG